MVPPFKSSNSSTLDRYQKTMPTVLYPHLQKSEYQIVAVIID